MARSMTIATVMVMVWACVPAVTASVVIDTVSVGNPGNPNDTLGAGYGSVDYVYAVGTYEVTAGQYTAFLNAVAADDTYGLYNANMWSNAQGCKIEQAGSAGSFTYSVAADWADRPVNFVSWGDAARFANWMHNGQPVGVQNLSTTEGGSYFLDGATTGPALLAIAREPDATWVIPTENEWYKAAYHKNDGVTRNYWLYPTSNDTDPVNDLIDPDPGNNATFNDGDFTIGPPYYRTEVGAHENSGSPYDTFDQGGNLLEWNEAVVPGLTPGRGVRGGNYSQGVGRMSADIRGGLAPVQQNTGIGFRVALIPEPATLGLLSLGGLLILRRRGSGR